MAPEDEEAVCANCGGEGALELSRYGGNDPDTWLAPCPECNEEPDPEPDDYANEREWDAYEPSDIEF